MTALDPYPQDLATLDEPIAVNQDAVLNRLVTAINRLAQAVEQDVLARLDNSPQNAPRAPLAALPPVQPQNGGVCPIHGTPWKVVPAGISKKTGNAYEAFRACSTQGCDQRPPR